MMYYILNLKVNCCIQYMLYKSGSSSGVILPDITSLTNSDLGLK